MSLVGRLRWGHICTWLVDYARDIYVPLGKKFMFIFFKNKLRKYVIIIIRLHNLKSDTDIAHIEPL